MWNTISNIKSKALLLSVVVALCDRSSVVLTTTRRTANNVVVNAFVVVVSKKTYYSSTEKKSSSSTHLWMSDSYVNQYEGWNGQRVGIDNNNNGRMTGNPIMQQQQMQQQRDYEYGMMKQQPQQQQTQGQQPLGGTGLGGISQQEQQLRASMNNNNGMNGISASTSSMSSMVPYNNYNFPSSHQQEQYRQSLPSYMRDTAAAAADPAQSMMPYSPPIRDLNTAPPVDPATSMMPYSPSVPGSGMQGTNTINGGDLRHTFNTNQGGRSTSNSALDIQGPNRYERYGASNNGNRLIQGDSRKTFSTNPYYNNGQSTQQEIVLSSGGGPLDAKVELWDGPNNTPTSLQVYSEDGQLRPFMTTIETQNPWNPYHSPGTSTSIRNEGPVEFPINAQISSPSYGSMIQREPKGPISKPLTVDGGSLKTWSFTHDVQAVHIKLTTDGLPLMSTIELWGVGGHTKQIAKIYQDDGLRKPFYATIPTPGYGGDTIAIRNTGPIEYPITASVEPLF